MITLRIPYKGASTDMISRWEKKELQLVGIDISTSSAHSWRTASVDKAKVTGISVKQILSRACWTRGHTFKKFYDKDIISKEFQEFKYDNRLIS